MPADEIIDRLYGLPLTEFTRARDEAARELRKAGEPEQAREVKGLRKPTAAAGAVNRLVRDHRAGVESFLGAAAALRDAQVAGKGSLATAIRREREALDRLTRIGGAAVRQTLLAAAVDEEAARQLLEARLERELEPRGFGTLLAHVKPAAKRATTKRAPAARKQPDDRALRAELRKATENVVAAEAAEREAARRWAQTQSALEQARAAAGKAQSSLDRLHGR